MSELTEAFKGGRNILVFADGTGNEGGLLPDESRTNVYKLFRATRVDPGSTVNPNQQIAFYIPGIGTDLAGRQVGLFGRLRNDVRQAVAGGLSDRIARCYVAIISVWRPGDRIYLFGFSRGAYTVRCVANLLERLGIPTRKMNGAAISLAPKELLSIANAAVKIFYRRGLLKPDDDKRAQAAEAFKAGCKCTVGAENGVIPYFIGAWDTVSAVGWSKLRPGGDDVHLAKGVMFVRHALAIDEYREDFKRVPWGGSGTVRTKVEGEPDPFLQVWFAGNHSDIGGSYPENESRLSDISLKWMADFISKELPTDARVLIDWSWLNLHPSHEGMMHDECMVGVARSPIPWDKKVRPVDPNGLLHESVIDRLKMPMVRNFETYGPYRPANLRGHPKARDFWAA